MSSHLLNVCFLSQVERSHARDQRVQRRSSVFEARPAECGSRLQGELCEDNIQQREISLPVALILV